MKLEVVKLSEAKRDFHNSHDHRRKRTPNKTAGGFHERQQISRPGNPCGGEIMQGEGMALCGGLPVPAETGYNLSYVWLTSFNTNDFRLFDLDLRHEVC